MKNLSTLLLLSCCTVVFLASCSSHNSGEQVQAPLEPVNCIVVLSATTSVDTEDSIKYDDAKTLEKGAVYANIILDSELSGRDDVRFLTPYQLSVLVPEISGGITGAAAALGEKLNCDAILSTTVRRFKEREGTEYASDSPAAVEFNMVLMQAATGRTLWYADYREAQKSFLSNIFSIDNIKKRGFKWVTAEQLMEQAIKERLAENPYLQ